MLSNLLKQERGDVPVLMSVALSAIIFVGGYFLQSSVITSTRELNTMLDQEAAFHAAEYAALSLYVSAKKNGNPPEGSQTFNVNATLDEAFKHVGYDPTNKPQSLLREFLIGRSHIQQAGIAGWLCAWFPWYSACQDAKQDPNNTPPIDPGEGEAPPPDNDPTDEEKEADRPRGLLETAPAAGDGNGNLIHRYTGDNLSSSYHLREDGRSEMCGQMNLTVGSSGHQTTQTTSVCLVSASAVNTDTSTSTSVGQDPDPQPQTPEVCVEDNNTEVKTFGLDSNGRGNPFLLRDKIATKISSHPEFKNFASDLVIRRSTNGSGGGNKWPNEGTIDESAMKLICNILGYEEYVSSTCYDSERSSKYRNGKCNYHSPGDNSMQYLTVSNKRFTGYKIGGSNKYKQTWLATITCKDKIICQ